MFLLYRAWDNNPFFSALPVKQCNNEKLLDTLQYGNRKFNFLYININELMDIYKQNRNLESSWISKVWSSK